MSDSQEIVFLPIDLERHLDEVVRNRLDSFVSSFGEEKGRAAFYGPDGDGVAKYIDWLKAKMAIDPYLAVHAWQGDRIIGQMELGTLKTDSSVGYVNLYYLIPEFRGTGVSKALDDYAVRYLKSKGHKTARLAVSPTNSRALRYYTRMGWADLGQRADAPELNWMEKSF